MSEASAPFSPPPCLACGACCFSAAEFYVTVTGDDWSRLGDNADQLAVWNNNKAFMRMEHGHCAALRSESTAAGKQFVCSIYDRRPQTCRDLARGSPQCESDWEQKASLAQAGES